MQKDKVISAELPAPTGAANDTTSLSEADVTNLKQRIGLLHLRQRLGIESEREAKVFGQGLNFFHLENWYSVHAVMRTALRLFGLHGRGQRNALDIQVRRNAIVSPRLPPEFEGFAILHISDPHLDMNSRIPHALIERIIDLDYDVCVLTGDFRARTFGPCEATVRAMEQVRPHLKESVYGVLGNHDSIRMVPRFEDMGIRMLLNDSVMLERGDAAIYLAGIDDPHYYRADNLEKACDGLPDEAFSILLSHSPEMYRHAAHAGFDLMLCGHTHGGQICLPGGTPVMCNMRAPRRLCAGAWTHHDMIGYTSAGSGVSIVDVRFNCPAEVTLHRLSAGPHSDAATTS